MGLRSSHSSVYAAEVIEAQRIVLERDFVLVGTDAYPPTAGRS